MILYKVAKALVGCVCHAFFRIKIEGLENIPEEGGFVICPNHKSLWDPPMIGALMPVQLNYMAKEELFKNKLFGAVLKAVGAFPVKRGTGDIGALKSAIKVLGEGGRITIFPEGKRSPKGSLSPGKGGAVLIALKSKVNILPVGIEGEYRLFSKITVRVGEPIDLSEYFDKRINSEVVNEITNNKLMPRISELSNIPLGIVEADAR